MIAQEYRAQSVIMTLMYIMSVVASATTLPTESKFESGKNTLYLIV